MNDNYAVINGKKIELTEKQIKALGFEARKNPFERVANGNVYYRVTEYGNIDEFIERSDLTDSNLYSNVNYFNDDSVAQQVALHQLLYRKLLKYAYDTGTIDDQPWSGVASHYAVDYCLDKIGFAIGEWVMTWRPCTVYFKTKQGARNAIRDVMEPFIKEHPEFLKEARNVSKN